MDLASKLEALALGCDSDLFLAAVQPSVSDAFESRWLQLRRDICELQVEPIQETTALMLHSVANRVEKICSALLDFEISPFPGLTEEKYQTNNSPSKVIKSASPLPSNSSTQHIKAAYDWLLENLNNPYPSVAVRKSIAQQSGSSRAHIDAWFTSARRRIGWNAFRHERFSNRKEMIAAATAFKQEDHKLDPYVNAKFVEIQTRAHTMYNERLHTSNLAKELSEAIVDATPELIAQVKEEQKEEEEKRKALRAEKRAAAKLAGQQARRAAQREALYVKAESLSPEPVDRKRRYDSPETEDDWPAKRSRCLHSLSHVCHSRSSRSSDESSSPSPVSRKRRVSDSDALEPPTKRWKLTRSTGAPLRSVSDPTLVLRSPSPLEYSRASTPALSSSSSAYDSEDSYSPAPQTPPQLPVEPQEPVKKEDLHRLPASLNPTFLSSWFHTLPYQDLEDPQVVERVGVDVAFEPYYNKLDLRSLYPQRRLIPDLENLPPQEAAPKEKERKSELLYLHFASPT